MGCHHSPPHSTKYSFLPFQPIPSHEHHVTHIPIRLLDTPITYDDDVFNKNLYKYRLSVIQNGFKETSDLNLFVSRSSGLSVHL